MKDQFKNQAANVDALCPKGVDHRGARATVEITQDNIRDFCNYKD